MSEEKLGADGSFEARLAAARARQAMDSTPAPKRQAAESILTQGFRVGSELAGALLVAVAIGLALDHWLHTRPIFLLIFAALGSVAGVTNVMRLVGPAKGPGRND